MKPVALKLAELALTNLATFSFPLVFAVVCGRALGLHDYGIVAFYSALAAFLGMVVEFGLDWHGIREVTQNLAQPSLIHRVLLQVTLAKLLVCLVVLAVAAPLLWWQRGPQEAPLMGAAAAYLVGFAADPAWYLRALERTRLLLAITTAVRLIGIALLLGVVAQVATMASALWAYAALALLASAAAWWQLWRQRLVGRAYVRLPEVLALLRRSWAIVLGNLNGALLTHGGIAVLGLVADPATVGAANLALRVRMAAQAVLLPLNQLGFVRLAGLARDTPLQALRLGRRLLGVTLGASVVLAAAGMLTAPMVSTLVFRAEVPVAVLLIMLLSLSVPLQAIGNLFGVQSLVALGCERRYAGIQVLASLAFLAVLLGAAASPLAYGWAVVLAEALVLGLAALTLSRLAVWRVPA